ncbi:MAG: hypothetical protein HYR56_05960 [Acidobacteria bacterium]|nr:hypothetical protein [Acidobacteriota bacterium]MBI3424695.1 hypothetical protein [Acidobacteriota bacterium]
MKQVKQAEKKAKSVKASTTTKKPVDVQTKVTSDALPRRTLADSLKVAQVIRDNYGTKATWPEIAAGLDVAETNPQNKYPLWAAVAYGLVVKQDDKNYLLSETGRKILAPTYEGEKEEGIKKALFTPSVLSRFFTDYNGSTIPTGELFLNVLETRYGIPRERTTEAIEIIRENARFAGALVTRSDGKELLNFSDMAFPVGAKSNLTDDDLSGDGKVNGSANETTQALSDHEEDWEKICFVITPIGLEESIERKHSDAILKHLLEPVLFEFGLRPIRADKIAKPGLITKQVIEYIAYSRLCIADLSFNNPNAFYELGVRQAFKLSAIQIIRKGDKIPFDVSQGRTIIIDTSDPYTILDRFESARKELKEHVYNTIKGNEKHDDNPIELFLPGLRVSISR